MTINEYVELLFVIKGKENDEQSTKTDEKAVFEVAQIVAAARNYPKATGLACL